MIDSFEFPRLTATNHRVTSPATSDYNCIAWAAVDTEQPGLYWPVSASAEDFGIDVLLAAFRALGFEPCAEGHAEADMRR